MNSFNSSQKSSSSSTFSSYQFDFGLGSSARGSSKPLKDQKANPTATAANRSASTPSWAPQLGKPSWTHQPSPAAAAINGPTSMVGDIFGKSWSSASPAPAAASSSIGIRKSDPDLFGDLVGSALNQGKSNINAPLKAAPPAKARFSMGNLADSLPKPSTNTNNFGNLGNSGINFGSNGSNFANFASMNQSSKTIGGQPMNSASAGGSNPKKDPFGSLMDFSSHKSAKAPINSKSSAAPGVDSSFGAFQDAKPANFGIPAQKPAMPAQKPTQTDDFAFGDFKNAERNDFGMPSSQPQANQAPASDPLDSLFASSKSPAGASASEQFSEMNDWDVGAEFGGQDHNEATTELEGLPPPPAGVTSSTAKSKGMENYKNGQFADAIKWLSWAVVLIEKSGNAAAADEVLTCRASCYKEVGEYKKAVADCTKVLERDSTNVSVLVQRALLYESTEKYRLGAEDLRTVLKIDPGNRVAKSTIHRLNKMAEI